MSSYEQAKKARAELHSQVISETSVHGTSIKFNESKKCWELVIHSTQTHEMDGKSINDFKISVKIHERVIPHSNDRRYRPLQGGCQIETSAGDIGTLGYFVKRPSDQNFYFLTNQHVMSGGYAFQAWQDSGTLIGECSYAVLTPKVDAAIGKLNPEVNIEALVIDIGKIYGTATITEKEVSKGDAFVQKYGRTTELRTGKVIYLDFCGARLDGWEFEGQMLIEADYDYFSDEGDSGSLVVNAESEAVGLLWGGVDNLSCISPIDDVLEALGVELL